MYLSMRQRTKAIKGNKRNRHFHSTSLQAAEVAKNAEVKRLLLTHISARYLGKQSQVEDEAKPSLKCSNCKRLRHCDC